jgi:hypothetical protein
MNFEFKDYYESKKRLIEAVDSSPKVKLQYKLNKYCKFPVYESIECTNKTYILLKPDDEVEILWEYDIPDNPTVRYIKYNGETYFPSWNNLKIFNWTVNNAIEM